MLTTSQPQPLQRETLLRLCKGNADAVALIEGAWLLSSVYDDAIDGDKKRTDDEVHQAFAFALFGLQDNRTFQQNRTVLRHALEHSINCWRAANELERSGDLEALRSAYVLRCSPYGFFVAVVLAVAGTQAAIEAATYFYGMKTDDSLESYVAEHLQKD